MEISDFFFRNSPAPDRQVVDNQNSCTNHTTSYSFMQQVVIFLLSRQGQDRCRSISFVFLWPTPVWKWTCTPILTLRLSHDFTRRSDHQHSPYFLLQLLRKDRPSLSVMIKQCAVGCYILYIVTLLIFETLFKTSWCPGESVVWCFFFCGVTVIRNLLSYMDLQRVSCEQQQKITLIEIS